MLQSVGCNSCCNKGVGWWWTQKYRFNFVNVWLPHKAHSSSAFLLSLFWSHQLGLFSQETRISYIIIYVRLLVAIKQRTGDGQQSSANLLSIHSVACSCKQLPPYVIVSDARSVYCIEHSLHCGFSIVDTQLIAQSRTYVAMWMHKNIIHLWKGMQNNEDKT